MKRKRCSPEDAANKKQRKNLASDIFDDESLSNCFCGVDSLANALGYFTGSVDMVWAGISNKFTFHFVSKCCTMDKKSHKIHVTFEGDWVKRTEAEWAPINIMDQLQLSLDGVTLTKPKGSKHTEKLIFGDGVIFKRIIPGHTRFVNTWQIEQEPPEDNSLKDWFATPAKPVTGPLSDLARRASNDHPQVATIEEEDKTSCSAIPDSIIQRATQSQLHKPPGSIQLAPLLKKASPDSPHFGHCDAVPAQQPTPQASVPLSLPTRETQSLRPCNAVRENRQTTGANVPAAPVGNESLASQNLTQPAEPSATATVPPGAPGAGAAKSNVVDLSRIGLEKINENSPEGWLAQLRYSQPRHTYITLKDAMEKKAGVLINIIGIVHNSKPPFRTRTTEWSTTYYLQDPSLVEDTEFRSIKELSVVFFQKKHKEWLPQAAPGDILILRGVKTQTHNGTSVVGYQDKAQWATYSTSQARLLEPQLGDAPNTMELVPGGFRFSPFLKGLSSEESYCKRLGEWWREKIRLLTEVAGQEYQLGGNIPGSSRSKRQRRLLRDARPDVEPNGYFDCVFEVLKGFQNDNGVHSLYVTDYTKNLQVTGCQAQWCPVGLNDYVVRFELWDEASRHGQSFKDGTFWDVRNARMVLSRNGYVEGKIVEKKFGQIFPDDDFEPLQALLRRKKDWEDENALKLPAFPRKLIRDTKVGEHINATVKLIKTTKLSNEVCLHVTDFTPHPELVPYRHEKEWSRGLEGRILSIFLHDAQAQYADKFPPGTYLTIKNLRLMHNYEKRFIGILGGWDVLISKLGPKSSNEHLQALRKQEADWEQEKGSEVNPSIQNPESHVQPIAQVSSSIKQLDANQKQKLKARLIAQIIDYYPRSPGKWIRAWCSKCKQMIPDDKRACYDCQDIDHEFVQYRFELVLLVQDKEGARTELYVRENCNLLQRIGIDRSRTTLSKLPELFQPLLGRCYEQGDCGENLTFLSFIIGQFEHPVHGTFRILLSFGN